MAGGSAPLGEIFQPLNQKGWMRLPPGTKVRIDTHMKP
jgi:hypothetical protein